LARVSRLTDIPADALYRRFRLKPGTTPKRAPVAEEEPTPVVAPPKGPLNARDRSERWILAILLAEPHRWSKLQQQVHPPDFVDPDRRQLAEVYWRQQQDEGEPQFNELLGNLSDPVAELAVELIKEFESLGDADARLKDAIEFLDEMRRSAEQEKQMARLRRTTAEDQNSPGGTEDDPLRKIQETARRPDLRRVGS
jgi:hypothetical protein